MRLMESIGSSGHAGDSLRFRDRRIDLPYRCDNVAHVLVRIRGIHRDADVAVPDIYRPRAAFCAEAQGLAVRRGKRGPARLEGLLLLDVGLQRQKHRALDRAGGNVFSSQRLDEAVALLLACSAEVYGRAEGAARIVALAELNAGQVRDSLLHARRSGAEVARDASQLAKLRPQHGAAVLVHAELHAREP